jgi:hypothetical protein
MKVKAVLLLMWMRKRRREQGMPEGNRVNIIKVCFMSI